MTLRPISSWPGEQTKHRQHSSFRRKEAGSWLTEPMPLSATLATLRRELNELGARQVVLEVAIREQDFRIDGTPWSNAKAEHPGVILSFRSRHGPLRYPCDTFVRWEDNLRAIALALEALRKVDRYGVTRHAEQYRGWQQIEGTPSGERPMDKEMAQKIIADVVGPLDKLTGFLTDGDLLRRARAAAHPDRHNGDRTLWRVSRVPRALPARSAPLVLPARTAAASRRSCVTPGATRRCCR